jgi:hypothetical protein
LPTRTQGSPVLKQKRDALKQDFAKKLGITVIPIPFWWDQSIASLAATIRQQRPDMQDLVQENVATISTTMPEVIHEGSYIPTVAAVYNEHLA